MNAIDVAIVVIVAIVAIRGFWRGFFREAFGLVGWLGGALAAALLAGVYAGDVGRALGLPPALGQPIAGLAIFAAVYLSCRIAGWVLFRLARAVFLAPLDRAAGFAFAAAKALCACAAILMVFSVRRGVPAVSERIPQSTIGRPLVEYGWGLVEAARARADIPEAAAFDPHWLTTPRPTHAARGERTPAPGRAPTARP